MKSNQPDHCMHVAAYYANQADRMANKPSYGMFGLPEFELLNGVPPIPASPPDPYRAVCYLKHAIADIRLATKFWQRAGGEVQT